METDNPAQTKGTIWPETRPQIRRNQSGKSDSPQDPWQGGFSKRMVTRRNHLFALRLVGVPNAVP